MTREPATTNCSDAIPKGYNHLGYAALDLCRDYVNEHEGDLCVHCKWFEMDEPATVFSLAIKREHKKEDAVADVRGDCVRFPPRVLLVGEEERTVWPSVSGNNRCGEFSEQRRCGEEICLLEYCD